MLRGCSSHRPRPEEAPPVRRPEEALAALAAATDSGRTACVAVGAVRGDHSPIALIVVEEATTRDLPTVLEGVLEATGDVTAAVFVASCGRGAELPDETVFEAVEGQCGRWAVELLEWFVPVRRGWVAVGEARGQAGRW